MKYRKNRLLARIRKHGRKGRLELARELRISTSRVGDFIQQMLDDGLLSEESKPKNRRGRNAVPVTVNPNFGYLIGFDMEANKMRLIAVDFAGRRVWEKSKHLDHRLEREKLTDLLLGFINRGVKEVHHRFGRLLGIGLACAGVLDIKRGVILHYDLIKGAYDIPLRDLVSSVTHLPCCMEDNIRALTLAEWMEGAAAHLNNFVCLAVRSGLGCGIVVDSRLLSGAHGLAGDAGSLVIPTGVSMGQWKRLYDLASDKALDLDAELKKGGNLLSAKARRAGETLGVLLSSLVTILDPTAVVLFGRLIQPSSPLWPYIEKTFYRWVIPELAERVALLPAILGPYSAALGASHFIFQNLYPII